MKTGFFLPNLGPAATPDNLVHVARQAEDLGLNSVWVTDRLLMPTKPSVPFRGSPDGVYPDAYRSSLDPLATLAFVAASTSRITLGTSILNINYHNPFVIGRTLTTIDVISRGRLSLGVGIGWHPDEFTAAGVAMRTRGRRADEFLRALQAIWTHNPVSFDGEFFQLPESSILPKPVQHPHPPLLLAVNSDAALHRAVRLDCGIHPANPSATDLADLSHRYRQLLKDNGRDPSSAQIVVRAEFRVTAEPITGDRPVFHGSLDQVTADIDGMRAGGATEIIFDPTYFVDSVEEFTEHIKFFADQNDT